MDRIGFPLVKVVWTDAESSDGWEDIRGIDRRCHEIITIGHLIEDTEDHVVIAMNLDIHNDKCSMVMVIPNFWIEDITELSV